MIGSFLLLIVLGLVLYLIVQHSITQVTRTPGWLLWLVLMMPAFLVGFWAATQGDQPIPPALLIGSFLVSSLLYIVLVRQNRRMPPEATPPGADQSRSVAANDKMAPTPNSKLRPLSQAEESQLQTCFPWSTYYLQKIDYRPQAVICRGQLRSQPEVAYQTVQQNVKAQFGDRFLVIFQQGLKDKPFFALVLNPQAGKTRRQPQAKLNRPVLAFGLLCATLITTTRAGVVGLVQPTITDQALRADPQLWRLGLPYALALMAILGMHELGHYFTARFYKIKATLPYFIPVPFAFGTFGAFIQMRSPVPNRKVLFDVGIAGPLMGFLVTLPVLLWGLSQSHLAQLPDDPTMLSLDAFSPQSSMLMALLCKMVFWGQLTPESAIHLAPIAIAGWLGLVITALNLMPVGQLDGGHIVHAMFGQRTGAIIGQITRLLVLLLSFIQRPLLLWAIILLFMPTVDEPALNDVSELDNGRDLLGLLALGLLLLIVLPVPNSLAGYLFAAP